MTDVYPLRFQIIGCFARRCAIADIPHHIPQKVDEPGGAAKIVAALDIPHVHRVENAGYDIRNYRTGRSIHEPRYGRQTSVTDVLVQQNILGDPLAEDGIFRERQGLDVNLHGSP